MGLFSKLFGNDETIKKGLDIVDEAFDTDQEIDERVIKKMELKTKLLEAYEAFKLAQRFLAMTFCPAYVIAWFTTFATELVLAIMQIERNLDKAYALLKGDMAIMVIIILTFYFGGGAVEGIVNRFKNRTQAK